MDVETSILVFDNFCPEIELVRESTFQSGFGTWAPNKGEVGSSVYEGMNFWGKHSYLMRSLSKALGDRPIFHNTAFFRITKPTTEKAYIHSDREAGSFSCIVYMSDHPVPEDPEMVSGTAFYKHRHTGMTMMPSMAELREREDFEDFKSQMVEGSENDWEQTTFIPGIFNRAIIFPAPLFHSRLPKNGLGDGTDETGRMVWACHFELK